MDFSFLPDRYKLIKQIGRGGMSTIYLADEQPLNRQVALKMLHPILSADPNNRARLKREAQAIAKLDHKNIVRIFNYLESGENCCIIMEYINGMTLDHFIQKHPISLPEIALALFIPIARGVHHFHQKGIIHRDIKPENVMITHDGIVKITDFGIASVSEDHNSLTATGSIMGSPMFMSPEHLNSNPVDHQSDIFSLGILLYHMLTGELPFSGKNTAQVLQQLSLGQFQPVQQHNPAISNGIANIVRRAMAYNQSQRYPSLMEMLSEINYYFQSLDLDPDTIRGEFLEKREAYTPILKEQLLTTYREKTRLYHRRKQYTKSIHYIRLILHYNPDDQEAQLFLKKLERQIPRWFIPTAVILLLLIATLSFLLITRKPEVKKNPDILWSPFLNSFKLPPNTINTGFKNILLSGSNIQTVLRNWHTTTFAMIAAKVEALETAASKPSKKTEPDKTPSVKKIVKRPVKKIVRKAVRRPLKKIIKKRPKPVAIKKTTPKPATVEQIPFKLPVRILPKAAEVFINGKSVGYAAMIRSIPLKTNQKTFLTVRSRGCVTQVKTLNYEKPVTQPYTLRLQWKNAILKIHNPKKYSIFIDNNFHSENTFYPHKEKFKLFSSGRKTITLRAVDRNERSVFKKDFVLTAGSTLSTTLP